MPKGSQTETTPYTDTDNDQVPSFDELMGSAPVADGAPGPIKKDNLIEVPFVIYDWRIVESTKFDKDRNPDSEGGGEYVEIKLKTADNEKHFFSDGSTGILMQVKRWMEKGIHPPLACPKGLRVSRYPNPYKPTEEAATYYIA